MKENAVFDYIVITLTLFIGMILTLLPIPPWAVWMRPEWVLAILIAWMINAPHRAGIGLAWCVGLFMDLLTGTLLGQQALVFCITAYFVLKFQHWFAHVPILQQTVVVFLLVLFDLIIARCVLTLIQHNPVDWLFWLPAVTTAIVWPIIGGVLYFFQTKLRIVDAN